MWLSYCQLMALLERENVFTALGDHLALATRGQGRLVLLRGEAGVRKTAVLSRFAGHARSVADVLVGGCDPLSTPRPLGPLVDVAAELGAAVQRELEWANGGPHGMTEVFRCVMDALGVRRPKVLIFEDVHWADEATLNLICLLGRRIERQATRDPMVSSGLRRPPLRARATPRSSCPRPKPTSPGATGSIRSPGGCRWGSTRPGESRSEI